MRVTSGISEEQSRKASGVQAARCSAVPWSPAPAFAVPAAAVRIKAAKTKKFFGNSFIGRPSFFGRSIFVMAGSSTLRDLGKALPWRLDPFGSKKT
jgi:hypothetical protein